VVDGVDVGDVNGATGREVDVEAGGDGGTIVGAEGVLAGAASSPAVSAPHPARARARRAAAHRR